MRPSAQPFLWKWVLFAWEWKINSLSKVEHLNSFWYRDPRELGNGLFIEDIKLVNKIQIENTLMGIEIVDCEQSLFSRSSLSSAGLERAKWPRGKLERGGKKRVPPSFPASSRASPQLLVFYFRSLPSLRSISSLAWPSWGTARSLLKLSQIACNSIQYISYIQTFIDI